jgi:hypothetical protein
MLPANVDNITDLFSCTVTDDEAATKNKRQ